MLKLETMPGYCSVVECKSSGRMLGRRFYRFPVLNALSARTLALTTARQAAWVTALNRTNFLPNHYKNARICDLHFISGILCFVLDVELVENIV